MADAADAGAGAAATAAQPAPCWRLELAAAKAVGLLCLAGLSVGFAAGGAAVVTIAACNYDEPCPVYRALVATSIRALVLAALLAPIAPLLVVRAAVCDCETSFTEELAVSLIWHLQTHRPPARSMLRKDVVRAFLVALAFVLLSAIGYLVLVVQSPARGFLF